MRRLLVPLLGLLLASCSGASSPGTAGESECISIAAWNDLHGQLAPDDVQVDATRIPAGGIVALADQIGALRAGADPVILLDAGDLFTGPLESTRAEGAPIIDAYNALGVDAVAIGNHEFDFGPVGYDRILATPDAREDADGPRGALLARIAAAHFPFLSANIHRTGGGALGWKNARPSTHIRRGGYDVGVVGYTTNETPLTTLKPNVVGLDFTTNAAAAVATEIRTLRAAGASPVVLLAHASLDGALPQHLEEPSDPKGLQASGEIASLLDAMPVADRPDVIVAGHRHQWMLGRVRGIPIVSSDSHGVGLSRIRYCRANGRPQLERIDRRVALASDVPRTPPGRAVAAAIAPWEAKETADADVVVTTLREPCLDKARNGSALVEQTARALAEHCGPAPNAPVVGFVNAGSVRTPLHAGPLRYRDLFAASPFENGVSLCLTTRSGLARTITNSINVPEVHDRLTFGIAGAKVTLLRAADGALALKDVIVDGAPRDDSAIWLAIPDFVLWGGDGLLDGVKCADTAMSKIRVRDAWREVIAREQSCHGGARNVVIQDP